MIINNFRGEYFFLSNFYAAPVTYKGLTYQNSEAAFQAQKTLDEETHREFTELDPSEAKRRGRHITLRSDWEQIKETIMHEIVMAKFVQNPDLTAKLLATGDIFLEEGNNWGDRTWGTVDGRGKNLLGKILMETRKTLRETPREVLSVLRNGQIGLGIEEPQPNTVKLWRYEAAGPFRMGGPRRTPIATMVNIYEHKMVDLDKGFKALVVESGPAKGVYELESGSLVGDTVAAVKDDIMACKDIGVIKTQIQEALRERENATIVSAVRFGLEE